MPIGSARRAGGRGREEGTRGTSRPARRNAAQRTRGTKALLAASLWSRGCGSVSTCDAPGSGFILHIPLYHSFIIDIIPPDNPAG